jgi:acyl carrier protein
MSVKSAVIDEIRRLAAENRTPTPDLTDDLVLLDSGLDSLAIAILVVRLEEASDSIRSLNRPTWRIR